MLIQFTVSNFASIRDEVTLSKLADRDTTPDGARTICVFDIFVATARANHANVYYYLKYLIEKASLIPQTGGEALLDDLMPWAETYRKYEQEQAAQDASLAIGGEDPPRSRTPRKKDKQRSA